MADGKFTDVLKVTDKQSVSDYCKQLSKSAADASLWSPSARFYEKKHIESTPTKILTPITRVRFLRLFFYSFSCDNFPNYFSNVFAIMFSSIIAILFSVFASLKIFLQDF